MKDQFLRPAKSQTKWYGLFSDQKVDPSAVSSWSTDVCKLNSSNSRNARQAGLSSTPPASRHISQETMCRWEKSSREATVICNQAASFNRCKFKIQQGMQAQLKSLRSESKGKSSNKVSAAIDELQYLMDFNASITQAAAKTMEHLTEFVFISMGNLTLSRRDEYLNHLKSGIKLDTLSALRAALLHILTLFPDFVIKRAEEEIAHYENKGQASSSRGKGRYHPYECENKRSDSRSDNRTEKPAWKNIQFGKVSYRKNKRCASNFSSLLAKGQQLLCKSFTGRTSGREQATDSRQDNELFFSKDTCKVSCCKSCTFCTLPFAKEKYKSWRVRLLSEMQIKMCERCFLCRTIVFCKTCNKCPSCCLKSACRGQTSKLLANMATPSPFGSDQNCQGHPPS